MERNSGNKSKSSRFSYFIKMLNSIIIIIIYTCYFLIFYKLKNHEETLVNKNWK